MKWQRTIVRPVTFEGVGLHTGKYSVIQLLPGEEDTGIVFEVCGSIFSVTPGNVCNTLQNITLCSNGRRVMTVEHLLSVFVGLGIDNVIVKVLEGEEIPILDGSAEVFVKEILNVGVTEQKKERKYLFVGKEVSLSRGGDQYLVVRPSDKFVVDYEIEFEVIGNERMRLEIDEEVYVREISRARTFGFIEDVERLREIGLALGASMDNVHVYSRKEKKALNGNRYPNESVRHKILDLLGAIALSPRRIVGEFVARKSGHFIDCELVKLVYDAHSVIG